MINKSLLYKYYTVMTLVIISIPVVFILVNYSMLIIHTLITSLTNDGGVFSNSLVYANLYLIFFVALFLLVVLGSRYFKKTIERINEAEDTVKTIANDESFPGKLNADEESKDEINELAKSINILIDRLRHKEMVLDDQAKYKREHLKQLSHDINTPLTAMNLELYQLSKEHQLTEEEMETLYEKVNYIGELVKEVSEAEQYDISQHYIFNNEITVSKLLDKSLMKWKYLFDKGGIEVNYEIVENIIWKGDELWLERLFDNILSNVYNHSKTSDIEIRLNQNVVIKDYGIGYSVEAHSAPGTGSAVIHNICKRFGIELDIHSNNKGTIYKLTQKQADS